MAWFEADPETDTFVFASHFKEVRFILKSSVWIQTKPNQSVTFLNLSHLTKLPHFWHERVLSQLFTVLWQILKSWLGMISCGPTAQWSQTTAARRKMNNAFLVGHSSSAGLSLILHYQKAVLGSLASLKTKAICPLCSAFTKLCQLLKKVRAACPLKTIPMTAAHRCFLKTSTSQRCDK